MDLHLPDLPVREAVGKLIGVLIPGQDVAV